MQKDIAYHYDKYLRGLKPKLTFGGGSCWLYQTHYFGGKSDFDEEVTLTVKNMSDGEFYAEW